MAVKPTVVGYQRALEGPESADVIRGRHLIAAFAAQESYTLSEIFEESDPTQPSAALSALLDVVHRLELRVVIVPNVFHLGRTAWTQQATRRQIERAGARVDVAESVPSDGERPTGDAHRTRMSSLLLGYLPHQQGDSRVRDWSGASLLLLVASGRGGWTWCSPICVMSPWAPSRWWSASITCSSGRVPGCWQSSIGTTCGTGCAGRCGPSLRTTSRCRVRSAGACICWSTGPRPGCSAARPFSNSPGWSDGMKLFERTPVQADFVLNRETLRTALRLRGLSLVHVGEHRANPETLTVYLHGPAGDWANGRALLVIAEVPGVVAAMESVSAPTIILVRVARREAADQELTSARSTGGDASN